MDEKQFQEMMAEMGSSEMSSRRDLNELCKSFMASDAPDQNIILESEFNKYMPLFNKEQMEKMSQDQRIALNKEYSSRFSLRHPIYVLSMEIDQEQGKYCPSDQQKHKVAAVLPPVFRQLNTLNVLGPDAVDLVTAFFNSSKDENNPVDNRADKYAFLLAYAMALANPPEQAEEAVRKFSEAERKLLGDKAGPSAEAQKQAQLTGQDSKVEIDW